MRVTIFLRFATSPGQDLYISGDLVHLANKGKESILLMNYLNSNLWFIDLQINVDKRKKDKLINYSFILQQNENVTIYDNGKHRLIDITSLQEDITIVDSWNDMGTIGNVFTTAPFKNVFFRNWNTQIKTSYDRHFRFTVLAPALEKDHKLIMTGNAMFLGNWLSTGQVEMSFDGKNWVTEFDILADLSSIEYKYCIVSTKTNSVIYEIGENRVLANIDLYKTKTIINDGYLRTDQYQWRGAGVSVPVFSLRTTKSLGVGDFNDLKKMVDWCHKVSIKLIQLLPVNDTTSTHTLKDSYPYSSISSHALHPLYVSVEKIAGKKHLNLVSSLINDGQQLNRSTSVDYEAVMDIKWRSLRILYKEMYKLTSESRAFKIFFKQNANWLIPYAVFSYLRDKYKTPCFNEWTIGKDFNPELLIELEGQSTVDHKECCLYYFVQYHLHKQLKYAHNYANQKGVILKGDIPIGVNRYGVETWTEPELFDLTMQAGAPPDAFAVKGQNWGFPTYNWTAIKHKNYSWWRKRFEHLSTYFDVFRIDHILGFFRIWSIPSDQIDGVMGRFIPAIPIMVEELTDVNIDFDLERYCNPYITDNILQEVAADCTTEIIKFLDPLSEGFYRLNPNYRTQKDVEIFFQSKKISKKNKKLKSILFTLISNVIFFRDSDVENALHFRFNMAESSSFKYLDKLTRQKLIHLYNDYFYYRQDQIWKHEALQKLPVLINSTDMLICGEDLGFIPKCVPDVMQSLGLLSLEVQRMPKLPNQQFVDLHKVRYLSVVTPSTHDMSTIRGWWKENMELSQQFYSNELSQHGVVPDNADTTIIKSVLLQHLTSNAQWAIFQIQDLLGIDDENWVDDPNDERINIPEDSNHYWKYRMKMSVDELLNNNSINSKIKFLIKSSGRD